MTAADYAALEARVAELEQQMRHVLPQKIDAVSYGVGLMHAEMRERLDHQGERLDRIELTLTEHGERFDAIDARLAAHDARFDAIDARLAAHDARFDALGRRFDGVDRRLDAQGEMLAEILRRLPGRPSNGPAGGEDDH